MEDALGWWEARGIIGAIKGKKRPSKAAARHTHCVPFGMACCGGGKMTHLDLDQSGSDLTRLRRGVPAQRRRLMVLSGFACAFAMVGVAAAVLNALL